MALLTRGVDITDASWYWHYGKESATREIHLPDDDPLVVEKTIQYLYTLDYSYSPAEKANKNATISTARRQTVRQAEKAQTEESQYPDPLFFHIWVYALADRLLINGLKTLAREYFHESLQRYLNSRDFGNAVEDVYSLTPPEDRGLRDLVIQVTLDNMRTLRQTGALRDDIFRKVPDFAIDLCIARINRDIPPSSFCYTY